MLLTLRYYATGNILRSAGDFSGVNISTATIYVNTVSDAITSLRPEIIKMPKNETEITKSMDDFYSMFKFPRVIGCIDGTHVRIQSPVGDNAEVFRNSKGYFSLNVQVLCEQFKSC